MPSIMPCPSAPAVPACPDWCAQHDVIPESDGSTFVVHHGPALDLDGRVRLRQGVHVRGDEIDPLPVEIVLDADELPLDEAHRLIAALALAATAVAA